LIVYQDVFEKLLDKGWSTYRLQKEHQMGNGTISRIKAGLSVSTDTIDTICKLCQCQPGELLRYVENKGEES
jgi:putative transcriptional regulator